MSLPDMTKSSQSVDKTKREIVEGKVMLRMVGYVECGKHKTTYMGAESIKDKVHIIFEVFGKNYPLENGQPMRVTVKENYSLNDKANFKKLFMMMRNGDKSITHMSHMLGQAFIGNIYKYEYNGNTYPTLKTKDGYKVSPAVMEDPETGEVKKINVPEPVSNLKRFIWSSQTKEDWDSLYIDGSYSDGNSKNVLQEFIKSAINFETSDINIYISCTSDTNFLLNGVKSDFKKEIENQSTESKRPPHFNPNRFSRQVAPIASKPVDADEEDFFKDF